MISSGKRVVLTEDPFPASSGESPWNRGRVDAKFVSIKDATARPLFVIYRLEFEVASSKTIRIHLTADERYRLFLDGEKIGEGSERGDAEHWFYETYDLELAAGKHALTALVWSMGDRHAPFAQTIVNHGFLCVCDDKSLSTGHAAWKCQPMRGLEIIPHTSTYSVGDRIRYVADKFTLDGLEGKGDWQDVVGVESPTLPEAVDLNPVRILRHSTLPSLMGGLWKNSKVRHVENCADWNTASVTYLEKNNLPDQVAGWQSLADGGRVTIPANTKIRCLIDLNDYVCGNWKIATSGGKGAKVRLYFQEGLIKDFKDGDRGNRDEIYGGHFVMMWSRNLGFGDEIFAAGNANQAFESFWWLCGRYLEIYVETQEEALELSGFELHEVGYPIHLSNPPFKCNDEELNEIVKICFRTLEMDSHDTYFDCPYYEQLQYVGDSRIESMIMMAVTDDRRLPLKATELYHWSIGYRGLTQSRYPSRNRQYIPPFSIWWVLMVHDQHVWQGDAKVMKRLLPGVRSVLSFFEQYIDRDPDSKTFGLMGSPDQWNFVDWIPAWKDGVPPGGLNGHCIPINMELVLALEAAVELETVYGQHHSQRPLLGWLNDLRKAVLKHVNKDGLLPDEPGGKTVSEQQHALAMLSNDKALQEIGKRWYSKPREGAAATYYFQHYRHEAFAKAGQHQRLLDNIRDQWGGMIKKGLKTTIEMPDPGRSDCHAWAAHPMLHLQTKILGLSPLESDVYEFRPHLCDLEWAEGYLSTGHGPIHARVTKDGSKWKASLVVPDGVKVSVPEVKGLIVGPKSVTIEP